MLQSLEVPLSDFTRVEPELARDRLAELRLVFDGTPAGEILVDDLGISRLGPAFWDGRIEPDTGVSATPR